MKGCMKKDMKGKMHEMERKEDKKEHMKEKREMKKDHMKKGKK